MVVFQAFAEATSSACSSGGFGRASQTTLAQAITEVYAVAIAEGVAIVTGGECEVTTLDVLEKHTSDDLSA